MKVVLAIDSFKGCMSSAEANAAAALGISDVYPDAECVCVPIADGGEGTVDAIISANSGDSGGQSRLACCSTWRPKE